MKYPREYLWFVERVLREHPRNVEELKRLEEMITAICHAPTISDSGTHGEGGNSSEEERLLEIKEGNKTYQYLLKRVETVENALKTLKSDEQELVDLLLWDDAWKSEVAEMMGVEERTVWRVKNRVLRKIAPFVIGSWLIKNT
jgi:DNA-directed RNA polymerase specialized sigma24 family protein